MKSLLLAVACVSLVGCGHDPIVTSSPTTPSSGLVRCDAYAGACNTRDGILQPDGTYTPRNPIPPRPDACFNPTSGYWLTCPVR